MVAVEAGKLRCKVTIQRATHTRDGAGAEVRTWATLQQAWASIEPMSGREREVAYATQADQSHRVTMRAVDGADMIASDRIVYGARTFAVVGPPMAEPGGDRILAYVNEVVD